MATTKNTKPVIIMSAEEAQRRALLLLAQTVNGRRIGAPKKGE